MSDNHNANQRPVKTYAGGKPNYVIAGSPEAYYNPMERSLSFTPGLSANWLPLYEKKEWAGLTDKEVESIVDYNTTDSHGYDVWCSGQGVARSVEAKLKEKNTHD